MNGLDDLPDVEVQIYYHRVFKDGFGPQVLEDLKRRFFFYAPLSDGIDNINLIALRAAMADVIKFIERQLRPIEQAQVEIPGATQEETDGGFNGDVTG